MRRHDVDLVALVTGTVFLAIAVTQVIAGTTDARIDLSWLVPVALVAIGVAGLAGALRGRGGDEL